MTGEEPDWIWPAGNTTGARGANDRVIVSCGIGRHYRERLRSTVNHCAVHCPDTWRLFYDCLPEGCPSHREHQYLFKIHALRRAIEAGFRYVLWMDTSFQPIASIEPLWQLIEEHGWFVPKQGDSVLGAWTSDSALERFRLSRDKAMSIPLCYSGLIGLDLRRIGRTIWEQWAALTDAFNGPHYNAARDLRMFVGHKITGWCSDDPRCNGHRHDESALSAVLYSLGITPMTSGLLTLESPQGIIGHGVPDYDVVAMRNWIKQMRGPKEFY